MKHGKRYLHSCSRGVATFTDVSNFLHYRPLAAPLLHEIDNFNFHSPPFIWGIVQKAIINPRMGDLGNYPRNAVIALCEESPNSRRGFTHGDFEVEDWRPRYFGPYVGHRVHPIISHIYDTNMLKYYIIH